MKIESDANDPWATAKHHINFDWLSMLVIEYRQLDQR